MKKGKLKPDWQKIFVYLILIVVSLIFYYCFFKFLAYIGLEASIWVIAVITIGGAFALKHEYEIAPIINDDI